MIAPLPPDSVFERTHDAVVLDGGCAGLAAARLLVARGLGVLVVEPSGQLLREITRSLAPRFETDDRAPAPEAAFWLEPGERAPDPALAEIRAARWLRDTPGVEALFYVMPLAATVEHGELVSVALATKAGPRTLRARRWIDATETGLLARLAGHEDAAPRRPTGSLHTMALHAADWTTAEDALLRICHDHGASLHPTRRPDERRLSWRAEANAPWLHEMSAWLKRLRVTTPIPSPVVVSQCSAEPLALYEHAASAAPTPAASLPFNLSLASPSLVPGPVVSLADRFRLGAHAASARTFDAPRPRPTTTPPTTRETPTTTCAVLVAGAGTAGALAALGSARAGARTLVLDLAAFPGGVGTGAGITAYFHGKGGGLHLEIDRATVGWSRLLEGRELSSRRWHHEAKKLALLERFERESVVFLGGCIPHSVDKDAHGRVRSVLVATLEGPLRIVASAFVDSTGDGDLCWLAGAGHVSGRPGDGRLLAYSQSAFILRDTPAGPEVASCNFDAGWTSPASPEDLTRARIEGVTQHAPAAPSRHSPLLAIAPLPGIRQSRQIVTDHVLTFRELVDQTRFHDTLLEVESIADTHSVDFEFEDDAVFFFYCVCRLFRHSLRAGFPYRALLPRGLANVWIACRAAGLEPAASYAIRMQRDMQRLGELAGRAAARAAQTGLASRDVTPSLLRDPPNPTPAPDDQPQKPTPYGMVLWRAWTAPDFAPGNLAAGPGHDETVRSFYEASVLAMRGDPRATPRLLRAIRDFEEGPPPSADNTGAHGQEIDLPFWLIAIVLLRRCGDERCLDAFVRLTQQPGLLLNVRTALALTLERLAASGSVDALRAAAIADLLVEDMPPDTLLAPSHSIWRSLRGAPQIRLRNDQGTDTRQDHAWQLHLVVARVRAAADLPPNAAALAGLADPRAHVRQRFAAALAAARQPA